MYFIKLRIFSNHYPVMHDATPKCRHSVGHSTQTHISKSIKTYIKAWLQAWIFFPVRYGMLQFYTALYTFHRIAMCIFLK